MKRARTKTGTFPQLSRKPNPGAFRLSLAQRLVESGRGQSSLWGAIFVFVGMLHPDFLTCDVAKGERISIFLKLRRPVRN